MYLQGMKQVYPRVEKVSASSFSPRGLFFSSIWTVQPRSDLGWQSRSWKRKVLSRKRKLGLDLFLLGIYLFPAQQNIYSLILELLHGRSGTGQTPQLSSVGIRFWPICSMSHFPFQFFLERKVFHSKFFLEWKVTQMSIKCLISKPRL